MNYNKKLHSLSVPNVTNSSIVVIDQSFIEWIEEKFKELDIPINGESHSLKKRFEDLFKHIKDKRSECIKTNPRCRTCDNRFKCCTR